MRIKKQDFKKVEDYDLKFSKNAQIAYDESPSEYVYVKKGVKIDDNTELYLFLDNDFEMSGTRAEMEEFFLQQYLECNEEAHELILKIRQLLDGKYYNGRNDEVSWLICELLNIDEGNDYRSLLESFEQYTKNIEL